ncbi:MAG: hypothetical protein DRP26_01935 [Candidatus Zixiibacteriota bacterium]|nr:MAG: hypothetical protein DRP26_01935 [candidate division Zixibacteria bacterium]
MKKLLVIATLIIIFCGPAFAGSIDGRLYERLSEMDDHDKVECVIMMVEQFDVSAFKQMMTMANSTRQERHQYVITSLQKIATETQPDLLAYLAQARQDGMVGEYKGFWITNAVIGQLSKDVIYEVARRSDVDVVYIWQEPDLIKPVPYNADTPVTSGVEPGLEAIGAPEMWDLGYTGQGRLVSNIDTGVSGNHPALYSRWRGNNGHPSDECWLDTTNPHSDFPYDNDGHGTHTMGTLTGLGETTGDTIGVAFGAQWIAARAVVDGGSVTQAFQWIADPDGDPQTIDDVPDVVSNSWGYHDFNCPQYCWTLIDRCEAAGVVVVFAAGNRFYGDPLYGSVWAPASRNTSPYNTFSVGAINGHTPSYPIADFSARGPSQCDDITIKPEVVAPGVNVRSSVPGGGYQWNGWSGTSMACPHVAGAVALLRQYNPNATPDTIKWALMETAVDLGSPGEDNDYGHGIINVRDALDLMPPFENPNVLITGFEVIEPNDGYPDPGDDIELIVTLTNTGTSVDNVYSIISTTDPNATITQDSAYFGNIEQDSSADNSSQPYAISISENTPIGIWISFELAIYGDGYSTTDDIQILIGQLGEPGIANHDIGDVDFTVSNFGQYGLYPTTLNPDWVGKGFKTPRFTTNYLFEGALLIGDGPTRVSNGARDENQILGDDFIPLTDIGQLEPGPVADQEYSSVFNDENAFEPLGIVISQKSYAWADSPDDKYIITEYDITNTGQEDLTGVRVAHFEDWDMPWDVANDKANFDRSRNLGYQYYTNIYRGMMVLNPEGAISFKALSNANEVYPPHFTLADKWSYMNAGFTDTAITTPEDVSIMITTGPFDIAVGENVKAAFAILGADNLSTLQEIADAAIFKYYNMTDVDERAKDIIPTSFGLVGNFPNPFNPSTSIRYSIGKPGAVKIDIYDLLGRRVRLLVDEYENPGIYDIVWDGKDTRGINVASGLYFVRLQNQEGTSSKKMLLLR